MILKVAEILTVKGGTGAIVEYFGPGAESLSATGKATICNMGAEIGATTSVFAYDAAMARYLKATNREAIADAADDVAAELRSDPEVYDDPSGYYDEVIEIDLRDLEPLINGPHTPDRARPVSQLGTEAEGEGWPLHISAALVGSCTNSSYEDITRAASIARLASSRGLTAKTKLMVTPGSERVHATIQRDGLLDDLEAIGAVVLANACGPCIGQWARDDVKEGDVNVIVNSYNRNFPKRNDGLASTLAFVTSPETVVALALAGRLDFDPRTDVLTNDAGEEIRLEIPVGEELPAKGFESGEAGFIPPPADGGTTVVKVDPAVRTTATARAVRSMGRQGPRRPGRTREGQGQVHDRSHLGRRAVAALPRPPREHLRQPVPRCRQCLHRRGRDGQGPARRHPEVLPRHRQALPRGRRGLGCDRRRELRRGLVA